MSDLSLATKQKTKIDIDNKYILGYSKFFQIFFIREECLHFYPINEWYFKNMTDRHNRSTIKVHPL